MSDNITARRYALTLFKLAKEAHIIDAVKKDLDAAKKIINSNPKWSLILDDLRAPLKIKEKMVDDVGQELKFQKYTISLLKLLAKNRSTHLLSKIEKTFQKKLLQFKKIVEAEVIVSNRDIWDKLKDEAHDAIFNYCGRKADIRLEVDSSIIGGMVIKIEDVVIDGSIKGEMNRLKKKLLDEVRAVI